MDKKIEPSQVSTQLKWNINKAIEFAGDLLEDVNSHNIAGALRAIDAELYDLACEFIQIEKEHRAAGHLTPELQNRRNALYERLWQARRSRP